MRGQDRRSSGAILAEVAVTMPLFLALIFFLIWIAVTANARQSLTSAVENAVRLGGTRGKAEVFQAVEGDRYVGAIPGIDAWHAGQGASARVKELLLSSDREDMALYNSPVKKIYGGGSAFEDLPAHYSYAVVYANEAMRLSVGEELRYPCIPDETDDLTEGQGCLFCYPVNPITLDSSPYSGAEDAQLLTYRTVAIRCDYSPSSMIMGMIQRLLAVLSGSEAESGRVRISRAATFDAFLR